MTTQDTGPEAILFGSLGTIAETSDLQRKAFNAAFEEAGLPWYWDPEAWRRLLAQGEDGRARIAAWAEARGDCAEAGALWRRASTLFLDMLAAVDLPLRPGVAEVITRASETGTRLALVTAAPSAWVDQLLRSVWPPIGRADFAAVVTEAQGVRAKPAPDCYTVALSRLGLAPGACLAVEDSPVAAAAALAAGVPVLGFPGRFHSGAAFGPVRTTLTALSSEALGLDRMAAAPRQRRDA
jgi:HAD superfamily hydrolase (TIGR01509 family)